MFAPSRFCSISDCMLIINAREIGSEEFGCRRENQRNARKCSIVSYVSLYIVYRFVVASTHLVLQTIVGCVSGSEGLRVPWSAKSVILIGCILNVEVPARINMYAVIKTGGKQYRVAPGDTLFVESLEAGEGEAVALNQVLMVVDGDKVSVGSPTVDGADVQAQVLSHGRGKKVKIIKFRRRKHYRRQAGHRQNFTQLLITSINGVSAPAKAASKAPAAAKPVDTSKADKKPAPAKEATAEVTAAPKFLDAPNGEPDDLKKISGVGGVLEGKLNALGIFHFSQIAALSDEEVSSIDSHLNFPGRIKRDDWLGQAKNLAEGGEPK